MIQKTRLCSIYKSKSPSCKCQAQIPAPKVKPGERFQPEREWKSCIRKSWDTFFVSLSDLDKQKARPVEHQLLQKPNELILHQSYALIEGRVTAGVLPQGHSQPKPLPRWKALKENSGLTQSPSDSLCFLIHASSNTHMPGRGGWNCYI